VTGRTRTVGVVVPRINRWFFGAALEGIESALGEADHDLTLYRVDDDPVRRKRVFEYFLARKGVDAIITVGVSLSQREIAALLDLGRPIVGIGGELDGMPTISIDDAAAARFVTRHLIGLGHSRILHLGDEADEQDGFHVHERRREGVREALAEAGLGYEEALRSVPYSVPGGYEGALAVLADPSTRPTAIVAGCDEIAIGAIVAARQLGIQIPAQLSVVGIDGHADAAMFGLTTLEQDPEAQGRHAVALVLGALSGGPLPAQHSEMPVTLAVRTSTTAPEA
jgi:DNA-binding LacI/PurR family transcriptional regulator